MRKNLLSSFLVAAGVAVGTMLPSQANAQKILDSQNYESATASDWVAGAGSSADFVTGDEIYGNYASASISGNGNRSQYKTVSIDASAIGYADEAKTTAGYVIEFDALLVSGNVNNRSVSQFIVTTAEIPNLASNDSYSGTDYVFALSQPTNTGSRSTAWYVNDLSNASEAISLSYSNWYHYTLTVTAASVNYAITSGEETVASGSLDIASESVPVVTGFWTLIGRGSGDYRFDNMNIYTYVEGDVANAPTITLTSLKGASRTYTISFTEGETLYYQLPGETGYTSVAEGSSVEVTTSTSGTLSAYTTKGEATSSTVTAEVEAVEITLNTPTYTLTDIVEDYWKIYTITIDNSDVLLQPNIIGVEVTCKEDPDFYQGTSSTGKTSFTFELEVLEKGTYVVTVNASGYTSSTLTIVNDTAYALSKTYNFSEMTEADFSSDVWTSGTDTDSRWGWSEDAPATYYAVTDVATSYATAIDGITLFTNKEPRVYIGYGLMAPYASLSGSGNYGVLSLTEAPDNGYAVYTYLNSYGRSTKTALQPASDSYSLYRYSDILQSIEVFTPTEGTATGINEIKTIEQAGDDAYYTISGVRVAAPSRGLYIKNGKKVVIK